MFPIAIVQNASNDGPSFFATWLGANGFAYQIFRMDLGEALPSALDDFSGLGILGGPMSANDDLPYYPALFGLINECIAQQKPVIGHCLGGQLLSRALGGTVQAAEHAEIGWSSLRQESPLAADWLGVNAPLELFQWHGESFSIPPPATRIATGDYCANQAYVVDGLHIGMQFHCEVDAPKVRDWLRTGAAEIALSASPAVQTPAQALEQLDAKLANSQAIASTIYQRWAQNLKH
jgi:GMP synthase-like glutamine amidotransferase